MKKCLGILFSLILVGCAYNIGKLYDVGMESTVKVAPNNYEDLFAGPGATGVVISKDGLILTAAHVCKAAADSKGIVGILDHKLERTEATVLWDNDQNFLDFCVMKSNEVDKKWKAAKLSRELPKNGEEVMHIGMANGVPFVVSHGYVFKTQEKDKQGRTFFRYDGASGPGSSGGPVFNKHGEVIGLVYQGNHFVVCSRLMRCERIPKAGSGRIEPITDFLKAEKDLKAAIKLRKSRTEEDVKKVVEQKPMPF
jgi:hypothetical protein